MRDWCLLAGTLLLSLCPRDVRGDGDKLELPSFMKLSKVCFYFQLVHPESCY